MIIIPTILCGGAGSRLWPVSRETHPKPFIRLSDGQSLLQKAWQRAVSLPHVQQVLTVSNRELIFKIRDEFREIADATGKSVFTRYILEPFGRNTAPAIAAAALQIAELHGEGALLLVLPADHLIADQAALGKAVSEAAQLAKTGRLVTFGIRPASPETGYGYIESDGQHVRRFIEKPALEQAHEYVSSGRFLWNAGMFCFAAGAVLREMARHCPQILDATAHCLAQSAHAEGKAFSQTILDEATFREVPDDSIDYALMEKSSNVAVIPCDIGWRDIGSWEALAELTEPDAAGNRIDGHATLRDVSDCYIRSEQRMIGAVGVKDLIVVDTPDALLITDRKRAQDVRLVYADLKRQGHDSFRQHRTIFRPWGFFTILETGDRFQIKRIEVLPGASLSLQMHYHRSEHWIVVSGVAKVINGEKEILVRANESTYIPAGHTHRLENPGVVNVVLIEVQSGEYLGEDDVVRFDDQYGRNDS